MYSNVYEETARQLRLLGYPVNLKGYRYLCDAVELLFEKPELETKVIVLYTMIAERHKDINASTSRVERAIRHYIESSMNNPNNPAIFGIGNSNWKNSNVIILLKMYIQDCLNNPQASNRLKVEPVKLERPAKGKDAEDIFFVSSAEAYAWLSSLPLNMVEQFSEQSVKKTVNCFQNCYKISIVQINRITGRISNDEDAIPQFCIGYTPFEQMKHYKGTENALHYMYTATGFTIDSAIINLANTVAKVFPEYL